MLRAEALGEQAVCAACQHYGFRFVDVDGGAMRVRCPKCGNHWLLDDPSAARAGDTG